MSAIETKTRPDLLTQLNAVAVRRRCHQVHDWVAAGHSAHFTLDDSRLATVAEAVATETRANYPDLAIPLHARWRHFSAGGIDRWARLAPALAAMPARERVRAAVDLAVISVLLDAGTGTSWRYREDGRDYARSEGLAVAAMAMFRAGLFSSDPAQPLCVDGAALRRLDLARLAAGFQHSDANPVAGLPHRLDLLRRLGHCLGDDAALFGTQRPGDLVDAITAKARGDVLAGGEILDLLVTALASIWPAGLVIDGIALGDVGRHPAIRTGDASAGLVPFHKLSQWLTYSLIEPLEAAGYKVDTAALTGLPEYRNGGLLIDLGVIVPRVPIDPALPQDVAGELIVEWRALTVTLLDRLLPLLRQRLDVPDLTLSQMLQGGTWSAGRAVALQRRPGGPPPIGVAATGTVF